ncbi:uncharacterized protein LOC109708971 [Ananas comosus]|uniref:Uncharacterized protein LOC109708971 n=1 Tax=Ananas comosus TaxID=4615 RepID=A0A6P5ESM7_ANACO|nr:uncharacterized protein LOC109708971 [Ananas comosus]
MRPLPLKLLSLLLFLLVLILFFSPSPLALIRSSAPHKLPFRSSDLLPLLPWRLAQPILKSLRRAVDLLTFVGTASSPGDSIEWKGACFYENKAWLECHNKSGSPYGGSTLHIKATQNNKEFIGCSPCSQAYLSSSNFHCSCAEKSGSDDKCEGPNVDITVLGVSELQRKLVGEGSHRNLVSTLRFIDCSDAMPNFLNSYDCEAVIIERLPRGVFADPFELQHLVNRRVFADVAVFGDTNLELPSALSNKSIVQIHMDLQHHNLLSNCEIVIELPLHARYPPLDVSGYATVDIGGPDLLLRFRPKEVSSNSCFWSVTPVDVGPAKMVKWQIPCGSEAHSGMVSTITFVSALVGAMSIVFSAVFYSPKNVSKIL